MVTATGWEVDKVRVNLRAYHHTRGRVFEADGTTWAPVDADEVRSRIHVSAAALTSALEVLRELAEVRVADDGVLWVQIK